MTLHCTSASHQTFCPIKCSLEPDVSRPPVLYSCGSNRSLVHIICIFCGEWHVVHYIGDRERFRQCKYAFHWGHTNAAPRTQSAPVHRHTIHGADNTHESAQTIKLNGPIWILHRMLYFIWDCGCQMWLLRSTALFQTVTVI